MRRSRPKFKVSVYLYFCCLWIDVTQISFENIKRKIERIISDSCFQLKSWFNVDARAPSIPLQNFPFKEYWSVAENYCSSFCPSIGKKLHRLKNWSPPGIEPGSMMWNAIALQSYRVAQKERKTYDHFISILVHQLWLLRQKWQILKMTLPRKNDRRIITPSSKLMILVSSCWEFFLYAIMHSLIWFIPWFTFIISQK